MKNDNVFTPRQIMQILIPGIYFASFLSLILAPFLKENFSYTTKEDLIFISLFSILFGLLFYLIDLPKILLHPIFPTTVIKNKLNISDHNIYFKFYDDELKSTFHNLTERYTSIFHLGINLSFASVILVLVYYISAYYDEVIYVNSIIKVIYLVFVLSIINSLLVIFGKNKIKYVFNRQVSKFVEWKNNQP
ncbi:hypothetical protein VUJ46_19055 [Chryseobacterium sp. MYb264]|uniref:hypothetical protein n=1 Tax=Chryseobacterium sp. MYb264 TaxID=2745153 RepID=UPI002E11ED70|nr:hypothetical protein VUJ46_19055 [Chryseobacterium sp. MYb264]